MEMEFDVIAICCDYTEYSDIEDFNNDYCTEYTDPKEIRESSTVLIFGDSFIVQN